MCRPLSVDLLGGIDTDSLEFLPDIDLLEVKRPHFYNHFGYVDLLGGMEKELSDRFADVDLLGGMEKELSDRFADVDLLGVSSTCPVHNRLLIGKTWHFGRVSSEKPGFTVGFQSKC